jgi:hypothetical protein
MFLGTRTCALFGAPTFAAFLGMDSAFARASSSLSGYWNNANSGVGPSQEDTWAALEEYKSRTHLLLTQMASLATDTTTFQAARCPAPASVED